MIGYVILGTNDMGKSAQFYDDVLSLCGAKRLMDLGDFILWGTSYKAASLAISKPYDGNPATVGNGVMAALQVSSNDMVDAIYNKVIELGGQCEGSPGQRESFFYAAYFRDLDGNKLNVFCP